MLMLLRNQTKPYELNRGESEALVTIGWSGCPVNLSRGKPSRMGGQGIFREIVSSFEAVSIRRFGKSRWGSSGRYT
jgi:hypothetical protein